MSTKYVIVEGTGTYSLYGKTFTLGATPVDTEEDAEIIAAIERDAPDWVSIQEDRVVPGPALNSDPEPVSEPYVAFKGRDGKYWYIAPATRVSPGGQIGPFGTGQAAVEDADRQKAADEAAEEVVPLSSEVNRTATGDLPAQSGVLESADVTPKATQVACRGAGCERTFKNEGARTNHERSKHPELFEDQKPKAPVEVQVPPAETEPPASVEDVTDPETQDPIEDAFEQEAAQELHEDIPAETVEPDTGAADQPETATETVETPTESDAG